MLNTTLIPGIDYAGVAAIILVHGGITVNAYTGQRPNSGWSVSLPESERIYPVETFSALDVERYVADQGHILAAPDRFLGGWVDDGKVYLDVSAIVPNRDTATLWGQIYGQLAVYNLTTGQAVSLAASLAR